MRRVFFALALTLLASVRAWAMDPSCDRVYGCLYGKPPAAAQPAPTPESASSPRQ